MARDEGAHSGTGTNVFSGTGGAVVQSKDVTGGIHLHTAEGSRLPVPRQLPATTGHFVNRVAELAQLDGYLTLNSDHPVVISAIAGTAGAGKTALAVHWAHQVREHFPDGDLYVNLRGYDEEAALTPGRVLEGFLRALDVPAERIPGDVEGQAALYRSVLNERRVLVVLDNAATPTQVRPLLPASRHSLTLVTSRSRLSGLVAQEGANPVTLDLLDENESVALLRRVVGDGRVDTEPEAAGELVQRCARLPLALRIVAERALNAPDGRLSDLAEDLAAERDRLDALSPSDEEASVRAVFSWSYRALPEECARVFRLVGLHPGSDISLPAVAALANLRTAPTRRHLEALVNANLLEQPSRDRYRFHDLLRTYATERAEQDEPEEERNRALDRLFDWYLRTADEAMRKSSDPEIFTVELDEPEHDIPVPEVNQQEALSWLDSECHNVPSLSQRASETGRTSFAWKFPVVFGPHFQMRGHSTLWKESSSVGLLATKYSGSLYGEAAIENDLGLVNYFYDRDYKLAINHFEKSLNLATQMGYRQGQALTLGNLSAPHRALNDYTTALNRANESRDIFRETGSAFGESTAESAIGSILRDLEEPHEALERFSRSYQLAKETENHLGMGFQLENIAKCQLYLDGPTGMMDPLFQAIEEYRTIDHQWGVATASEALGTALKSEGRDSEAKVSWECALEIFEAESPARATQLRAQLDALA